MVDRKRSEVYSKATPCFYSYNLSFYYIMHLLNLVLKIGSIPRQLIKELEEFHNETESYSTLFSITTEILQINQVNNIMVPKI